MPWQIAVNEVGEDREVKDNAPHDRDRDVLPDTGGPHILPITEEAGESDREPEAEGDLQMGGLATIERGGDQSRQDHDRTEVERNHDDATDSQDWELTANPSRFLDPLPAPVATGPARGPWLPIRTASPCAYHGPRSPSCQDWRCPAGRDREDSITPARACGEDANPIGHEDVPARRSW